MNPLLFIMPVFSAYLVFRAFRHKKAGRTKWCIHYLFMAGLMLAVFGFELWMNR